MIESQTSVTSITVSEAEDVSLLFTAMCYARHYCEEQQVDRDRVVKVMSLCEKIQDKITGDRV